MIIMKCGHVGIFFVVVVFALDFGSQRASNSNIKCYRGSCFTRTVKPSNDERKHKMAGGLHQDSWL